MNAYAFSSYPWDLHNRYPQDKSVVNKMQQVLGNKQAFIKATMWEEEDEHVVASDADLDVTRGERFMALDP